jgi:hypothetical protein
MTDENNNSEQEEVQKDELEAMMEEKARNQVRSDYRRSLGNEHGRRYHE